MTEVVVRGQDHREPAVRGRPAYTVSPQIVASYAEAVGETDPKCRDVRAAAEAGLPGLLAPPGFAFVVAYPLSGDVLRRAGIRPQAITHVAETHRMVRAITSGDVLESIAINKRFHTSAGGRTFLSWDVELTDAGGRLVGTTSSTVLLHAGERWPERSPAGPVAPVRDELRHRARYHVTRGHVARYCGVSGDVHPVHWSDAAARRSGLPGVIMHGSLLFAVVARAASCACGGPASVAELGARFAAPVEVPDDEGIVVEVAAGDPDADGTVALDARVGGRPVLTSAWARPTAPSATRRAARCADERGGAARPGPRP